MTPPPPDLGMFLRVLRDRRRVAFFLVDDLRLEGVPKAGIVDLQRAEVFLDSSLTDGALRATVAHELVHLAAPEAEDDQVESTTAELLVPLPEALAAQASGDLDGLAERLVVDPALVRARLRYPVGDGSRLVG